MLSNRSNKKKFPKYQREGKGWGWGGINFVEDQEKEQRKQGAGKIKEWILITKYHCGRSHF